MKLSELWGGGNHLGRLLPCSQGEWSPLPFNPVGAHWVPNSNILSVTKDLTETGELKIVYHYFNTDCWGK